MVAKSDPRYGRGSHEIHAVDPETAIELLVHEIGKAIQAPDYNPPALPAVAMELLALSRDPNVDFRGIVKLLEKDPLIAARVLRLARSALLSGGANVSSLTQAISRLGLKKLTDLVWQVSLNTRVFRAPGYEEPLRKLQQHSTLVAHLTERVCTAAREDVTDAFLCGLLHDAGMAACLVVLGERKPPGRPPFDRAWPAVSRAAELAGRKLGELWQLPSPVREIVSRDVTPTSSRRVERLSRAVSAANCIAARVRAPLEVGACGLTSVDAARALGIDDLAPLLEEARQLAARLDAA